jgi:hypothetical protein
MSYIGAEPTTAAFPFDQFSGNGSTTAFTLTYAPASTTSIIVAISGVVQNPNTYSCVGTTLNFSPAPPTGTNNISVLYLGLPVIGVSSPGNTAYFSSTSFTATGGQTTFTPSGSYQVGFINVIRNGSQLAPADYTATNGTTVTLLNPCVAGDIVVIEVFTLTSISNALPLTGGTVTGATTFNTNVTVNGGLASGFTGMKNRIINGGMVIDQRNAGASVSMSSVVYPVDRWAAFEDTDGSMTAQQSTVVPAGFINSVVITTTSADASLSASQYARIFQNIEGLNVLDFGWGSASAQPITVSFWVRSSLTGTFGGSISNSAFNRSYPFSYTISAANTYEYKTVVVPGDTSGTWLTTNGIGIQLNFGLGVGSTFSGTAGAWAGSGLLSSTGATSVVGTNGATWYVTGVQLERGSNATSFEFRDYGRELIMCQRYTYRHSAEGDIDNFAPLGMGRYYGTNAAQLYVPFKVTMRTPPSTVTQIGNIAVNDTTFSSFAITLTFNETASSGATVVGTTTSGTTAGFATTFYANGTSSAALIFSAEL